MPEVSFLTEEADAIIKGLRFFFQSSSASPKRRHKKASFVHPEWLSFSILVWIRHMCLLSYFLCFDSYFQISLWVSDLNCYQTELNWKCAPGGQLVHLNYEWPFRWLQRGHIGLIWSNFSFQTHNTCIVNMGSSTNIFIPFLLVPTLSTPYYFLVQTRTFASSSSLRIEATRPRKCLAVSGTDLSLTTVLASRH